MVKILSRFRVGRVCVLSAWLLLSQGAQAQDGGWYPGITQPVMDSVLGSPSDGVIGERFFGEGDAVTSGDVILALRTDTERVEVARRSVALTLAENELSRLRQLSEKTSSVSSERLETADANYQIAKADKELAEARLRDRQVIAPFGGVIADLLEHEVGEGTKVGDPLVRLVNTDKVLLVCNLPSAVGEGLKLGQAVQARVMGIPEEVPLNGQVVFVSPVVDAASGLLRIKIEIANEIHGIRPGVTGRVLIQSKG